MNAKSKLSGFVSEYLVDLTYFRNLSSDLWIIELLIAKKIKINGPAVADVKRNGRTTHKVKITRKFFKEWQKCNLFFC